MGSRFPKFERTDGVKQMLVPVPHCELCFKPIPQSYGRTTGQCYHCYTGSPIDGETLERVIAATLYIPNVDGYAHSEEILALKGGGLADQYAEVLMHVCGEEELKFRRNGLLVPIPRTTPRRATSGPEALATSLSPECGLGVRKTLSFTRAVRSQKGLSAAERKKNVENSMASDTSVSGRDIYLVDDILTTGETMHEGARAVRQAGATSAIGLVAGRDASLSDLEYAGVLKRVEE